MTAQSIKCVRHTATHCLTATAVLLALASMLATTARACSNPDSAIGVSRIVEIDTRNGPLFGRASRFKPQMRFLRDNEIVLTFDDGPSPQLTGTILDALAAHCTRATFFPVGKRALRYAATVRAIADAGHTLGAHTFSHPRNLARIPRSEAHREIERGFAATEIAAGVPIAPFFRFTGLNENRELLAYVQSRQLAIFNVDVITNDSFAKSAGELIDLTLKRARARRGGILLFHDLKPVTARAMPELLRQLKAAGFRVVHVTPASSLQRDRSGDAAFEQAVAERRSRAPRSARELAARTTISPRRPDVETVQITPQQPPFMDSSRTTEGAKRTTNYQPPDAWHTTIEPPR